MRTLKVLALVVACLLALRQAPAQVIFNDGLPHTIDGTGILPTGSPIAADIFDTDGGDAAIVENFGGTPTPLELTTGGTIGVSNSNTNESVAVRVRDTSSFTFSGGTLSSSDANGNDNAIGIIAEDSSTVVVSGAGSFTILDAGATDGGRTVAFILRDTSTLNMLAGGVVDSVLNEGGGGQTNGIWIDNNAGPDDPTAIVGGTFTLISDAPGATGSVRGIQIDNNIEGVVDITLTDAASITVDENDDGAAFGIRAEGGNNQSLIAMAGTLNVTERDSGDGYGIRHEGAGQVNVSGAITLTESGGGVARGIRADGSATVALSGGVTVDESDGGAAHGIHADGSSNTVQISMPGTLNVTERNGGDAFGIRAEGDGLLGDPMDVTGTVNVTEEDGGAGYGIWVGGTREADLSGPVNVTESGGGSARAIFGQDTARLTISSNIVVDESNADGAHAVRLEDSAYALFSGTADVTERSGGAAYGIRTLNSATFVGTADADVTVTEPEDPGSNSGDAYGIRAEGGTVTYAGRLDISEEDGGVGYGIRAEGTATVGFSGSVELFERNAGNAFGVRAQNDSTVDVAGELTIDERSGGHLYAIQAGGNATANVSASLELDERGDGDVRVIRTNASGHINILTGFSYNAVEDDGGNIRFLEANDESLVDIFGGDIVNEGTVGTNRDRIDVFDDALVTIYGHEFFVDGVPVDTTLLTMADMGGAAWIEVSGTLWDRTAFSNRVDINDSGAVLLYVPEPTTLALLGLGALALLCRRRRKR